MSFSLVLLSRVSPQFALNSPALRCAQLRFLRPLYRQHRSTLFVCPPASGSPQLRTYSAPPAAAVGPQHRGSPSFQFQGFPRWRMIFRFSLLLFPVVVAIISHLQALSLVSRISHQLILMKLNQ